MRRANNGRKCLAGKREVVAETARSRDQSMVLPTPWRATDARMLHADAPRRIMICPRRAYSALAAAERSPLQVAEIPLRARKSGNASLARELRITSVV